MKIFFSWSGSQSKKVAEILRDFLLFVFHDIDPWISSEDIGKGKRWSSEIAQALEDANIGVICLTKENLNRPWLLFEAGALSKRIKDSLVCTFLLDIEEADIINSNPLSQFQHTKNSKEDVFAFLKTINEAYGEKKLDDAILEPTFEKWWLDFEKKISLIPSSPKKENEPPVRKDSEILAEILETVRNIERERSLIKSSPTPEKFHTKVLNIISQDKLFEIISTRINGIVIPNGAYIKILEPVKERQIRVVLSKRLDELTYSKIFDMLQHDFGINGVTWI
ncbi:MAG: toll/interleukin-1 receptor domain-containing protein [Candidatus Methanoperedens sp.]|nr:toll/interleukin-1 receptor domain-containing protein [Candidatus Methanoperedens sp.]